MNTTMIIAIICGAGIAAIAVLAVILRKNMKKINQSIVYDQPDPTETSSEEPEDFFPETINAMELPNGRYFDRLYLPRGNDSPDEIRRILIHPKGIFIFRYIDIKGWVLGREDSRWWTHFTSTSEKDYIDNPTWESDDDIEKMITFFPKTTDKHYYSYIVFSDQCELRSVELWGNSRVINKHDFQRILSNDLKTPADAFPDQIYYHMLRVFDVLSSSENLEERLNTLKTEMKAEQNQVDDASEDHNKVKSARLKHLRPEDCFTRPELALRDALIIWRKQQALQLDITEFEIFDNRTLDQIVLSKPAKMRSLAGIPGMDPDRCERFGKQILVMVEHTPQI